MRLLILMMAIISFEICPALSTAPPGDRKTHLYNYNYFFGCGRSDLIRDVHNKYDMEDIFTEYISSLPRDAFQGDNLSKLVDIINNLPHAKDKCYALNEVAKRLNNFGMSGMHEHFKIQHLVKKTRDANSWGLQRCYSAAEYTPDVFRKVLDGDTSDCKLINRLSNEPLYCTDSLVTEHGYRRIVTKTYGMSEPDEYWNLRIIGDSYVYLRNNYRSNYDMRYIFGTVRGSDYVLNSAYDYFRIHTIDDDYIVLEPTSEKLFVTVTSSYEYDFLSKLRIVGMTDDINDKKAHWELKCY